LRMRVDPFHLIQRAAGQCQEVMNHGHLELPDNRQIVFEQQIEIAVNAAANGVLNREHAKIDGVVAHRSKHVFEALTGQHLTVRGDLLRGGLAERSWFSLIGDTHARNSWDALKDVPYKSEEGVPCKSGEGIRCRKHAEKTKRAISLIG